MDAIASELWQALKIMSWPQWLVLLALSLLIGAALFQVFNWLYRERANSQAALIELKDKLIEQYKASTGAPQPVTSLATLVPSEWETHLAQVAEQLTDFLQEAEGGLGYISANLGFVVDADVFIHYVRLLQASPGNAAVRLKNEQTAWLVKRNEQAQQAVEHPDGTLGTLEYNMAFIALSQQRLRELQARI